MKDLYSEIIQQQDFGFVDKEENNIKKKLESFQDKTKLITDKVKLYVYRVNYQYKTKRGNLKENYKLLILKDVDELEARTQFIEYINDFNREFPFRAILNVKILNISYEEILIPLI